MASFNKVILLGNLTRDPQLRYLPSQMAVTEFGLACNRKFKTSTGEQREEVLFVDCTAWGKQAEIINQYCTKGRPLFVEGRLKLDSWEDNNGGGKRSKLTVVVENFQLLGGRDGQGAPPGAGEGPSGASDGPPAASAPRKSAPPAQAQQPPYADEPHFKDDDIPF
ncbi:MAG TPA: single-stranded DNA-binding protein [Tepidisphaeraceae bacterium]|nr:single-stranded DNA-binding protein [Tepidisphaeraceae bacterium]